jgi:hypothetical protein
MHAFKIWTKILVTISLTFQNLAVSGQSASQKRKLAPAKQWPSLVAMSAEAKDFGDFIYKMKPALTPSQFLFFTQVLKRIARHKMPRIVELQPGSYEIRLNETVATLKTVSVENETYLLNGKTLNLSGLSLADRMERIEKTLAEKQARLWIWSFVIPEAAAELMSALGFGITVVIAVITAVNNNRAACDNVTARALACMDLSGKLITHLRATEAFIDAQKKFIGTNTAKSPELAAKIEGACKELNARTAEVRMTIFGGESGDRRWAWCGEDRDGLRTCLSELRSSETNLKQYVKDLCSPATTTAEAPIDTSSRLTSGESSVPLKTSLEKAANPPTTAPPSTK